MDSNASRAREVERNMSGWRFLLDCGAHAPHEPIKTRFVQGPLCLPHETDFSDIASRQLSAKGGGHALRGDLSGDGRFGFNSLAVLKSTAA